MLKRRSDQFGIMFRQFFRGYVRHEHMIFGTVITTIVGFR